MKLSAKLHQAGKQLWQEALSKFPGDDVAARAWFDEHIIHRIEQLPDNEEAAQEDGLIEARASMPSLQFSILHNATELSPQFVDKPSNL